MKSLQILDGHFLRHELEVRWKQSKETFHSLVVLYRNNGTQTITPVSEKEAMQEYGGSDGKVPCYPNLCTRQNRFANLNLVENDRCFRNFRETPDDGRSKTVRNTG